jgi:hypothetical protein
VPEGFCQSGVVANERVGKSVKGRHERQSCLLEASQRNDAQSPIRRSSSTLRLCNPGLPQSELAAMQCSDMHARLLPCHIASQQQDVNPHPILRARCLSWRSMHSTHRLFSRSWGHVVWIILLQKFLSLLIVRRILSSYARVMAPTDISCSLIVSKCCNIAFADDEGGDSCQP